MQCNIHEQWRKHTALSYPRFTGQIGVAIYDARREPGIDGPVECRKGLQLLQDHALVNRIEGPFDIGLEDKHGLTFNGH